MWFNLRVAIVTFVLRVLRVPIDVKTISIKREDDVLPPAHEQLKAMAAIFHLVPGLRAQWHSGLGEVIGKMATTPATDQFHGERIRLCQRAVDLWQCLELSTEATVRYNALGNREKEDDKAANHHGMVI